MSRPCVGCGFCCIKAPCAAAVRVYAIRQGRCPGLVWDTTRYRCALMQLQGQAGDDYRRELAAGVGCCAGLNTWRQEVKER